MKMIINNHRNRIRESESTTMMHTPISELNQTQNLNPEDLIHIVQKQSDSQYDSRRMTIGQFQRKLYEAVQNTLKVEYCKTHMEWVDENPDHVDDNVEQNYPDGSSFKDIAAYLKRMNCMPEEVETDEEDGFVKHVFLDMDILKRYVVLKNQDIESNISRIDQMTTELDDHFGQQMELNTTKLDANGELIDTHESVNSVGDENHNYCQMSISTGNKISNTWVCNASGNLVVYGWLDSSAALNNKAIPSSYCVLEGNINNYWEIIGVESVIPAKSITYVGFTVPVKKGLEIRARTGFVVGGKSGQYSNDQDGFETLSNSTPNGFKCMIFSHPRKNEANFMNYLLLYGNEGEDTSKTYIVYIDQNGLLRSELYEGSDPIVRRYILLQKNMGQDEDSSTTIYKVYIDANGYVNSKPIEESSTDDEYEDEDEYGETPYAYINMPGNMGVEADKVYVVYMDDTGHLRTSV